MGKIKREGVMHALAQAKYLLFSALISLAACSGGGSASNTYAVSGVVNGLSGTGLVLRNNGNDDLAISGASFEFSKKLKKSDNYNVTVLMQPLGQNCDVAKNNGLIINDNVKDITVTCRGWRAAQLIEDNGVGNGLK